jgi:hypothetical protein
MLLLRLVDGRQLLKGHDRKRVVLQNELIGPGGLGGVSHGFRQGSYERSINRGVSKDATYLCSATPAPMQKEAHSAESA